MDAALSEFLLSHFKSDEEFLKAEKALDEAIAQPDAPSDISRNEQLPKQEEVRQTVRYITEGSSASKSNKAAGHCYFE